MVQTREQARAQKAFELVSAVKENREDYGRQCKHLPSLIHECGLVQTVAFMLAKGKTPVVTDLAAVMQINDLPVNARTADLAEYMRLSREALASAQWMKRYAEALGLVKEGDE